VEQQKGLDEIAARAGGRDYSCDGAAVDGLVGERTLDPLLVSLKGVDPAMYPFLRRRAVGKPAAPLKTVFGGLRRWWWRTIF